MDANPNGGGDMKKSASSRFQVARVDTKENQGKENGADVQSKPNNQRKKSFEFRMKSHDLPKIEIGAKSASSEGPLSIGPESPNATTFSLSGDSLRSRSSVDGYNKTHCVMNTMEALPCVDHYRNVFSATGGGNLKARPTLAELHEERVSMKQQFMLKYLFWKIVLKKPSFFMGKKLHYKSNNFNGLNIYNGSYFCDPTPCLHFS